MADVSIVFRSRDGTHTGKIYVNDYQAAAEMASRLCNASHIVDVINRRDEVALRWKNGAPDWKLGQVPLIKLVVPAYEFLRYQGNYIDAENRLRLLVDAIPFAFDTATDNADELTFETLLAQTEHHGGDDIWGLVRDARITAETAAKASSPEEWATVIDGWMSDPDRLFVQYVVEFNALTMKTPDIHFENRVARLGAELAKMEAQKT